MLLIGLQYLLATNIKTIRCVYDAAFSQGVDSPSFVGWFAVSAAACSLNDPFLQGGL